MRLTGAEPIKTTHAVKHYMQWYHDKCYGPSDWAKEEGSEALIELREDSNGWPAGLFATTRVDVPSGHMRTLMGVPPYCMISKISGYESPHYKLFLGEKYNAQFTNLANVVVLLMFEAATPNGFFRPMIDLMPAEAPSLDMWSDDELAWLQNSTALTHLARQRPAMRSYYDDVIVPLMRKYSIPDDLWSWQQYRWAFLVSVMMKSTQHPKLEDLEVISPFLNMMNHRDVDEQTTETKMAQLSGLRDACDNACLNRFNIVTDNDMLASEQLYLNLRPIGSQPLSNNQRIFTYGYALKGFQNETLALDSESTLAKCIASDTRDICDNRMRNLKGRFQLNQHKFTIRLGPIYNHVIGRLYTAIVDMDGPCKRDHIVPLLEQWPDDLAAPYASLEPDFLADVTGKTAVDPHQCSPVLLNVFRHLRRAVVGTLSTFDTSLAEDRKLEQRDLLLTRRQRFALYTRISEKLVLEYNARLVDVWIKRMTVVCDRLGYSQPPFVPGRDHDLHPLRVDAWLAKTDVAAADADVAHDEL